MIHQNIVRLLPEKCNIARGFLFQFPALGAVSYNHKRKTVSIECLYRKVSLLIRIQLTNKQIKSFIRTTTEFSEMNRWIDNS